MAVNLLLSYAFHGTRMLDTDLGAVRRELVCGRLMVDSGAFTAYRTGKPVDLVEYAEWLERWRGTWDHAVTLDVIGNPTASHRQTARLHSRGLPVMPVFTIGDKLAEFDAMVRDSRYVCVGGLVGRGVQRPVRDRIAMLQRRAAETGGGIHALGVGNAESLRRAHPYSADASVISAAFQYGNVVYWDGRRVHNCGVREKRAQLIRDRDHITAQDIPLGALLRAGRLPAGRNRGRAHRRLHPHLRVRGRGVQTRPGARPRWGTPRAPPVLQRHTGVGGHAVGPPGPAPPRRVSTRGVATLRRPAHLPPRAGGGARVSRPPTDVVSLMRAAMDGHPEVEERLRRHLASRLDVPVSAVTVAVVAPCGDGGRLRIEVRRP